MDGKTYKKGDTIKEREFNQRIMKLVEKELDRHSKDISYIECVGAITEDTPLANRVKKANNSKADLFLSFHANALKGTEQTKAYGLVSIHTKNCSSKSIALANKCYNHLSKDVTWYSNGATKYGVRTDVDLTGNTYYVLRNTVMPAVLLELGFMDNLNDVEVMVTDKFAKDCAKAIAKAICEQLGVTYINAQEQQQNPSTSKPEPTNVYYRVCVGSYTERSYADKALQEAKAKGYKDAFIAIYNK